MNHKGAIVLAAVLILSVAILGYIGSRSENPISANASTVAPTPTNSPYIRPPSPTPTAIVHRLRYYVDVPSGDHVSITYINDQGGTEQVDYSGPWDKVFTVQSGFTAYITAQLTGSIAGKISCDIELDGQNVRHSESTGAYVLTTCSGVVD